MARKKEEVILIDDQEPMELDETLGLPEEISGEPEQNGELAVFSELPQEAGLSIETPLQEEQAFNEELQDGLAEEIQQEPFLPDADKFSDGIETVQEIVAADIEPEVGTELENESEPEPARPRRRNHRNTNQVLSIDDNTQVRSAEEEENQVWLELRNAQRGRRILSGTLSGIERLENGLPMAIVYYKNNIRVAIPATEMMINIANQEDQSELVIYNRYAQLLSRMLATEIDFLIAGLDRRNGVVLGSRKQAMERKQQRYYLNPDTDGQYLINEGQIVEARVMVVSEKQMRLEVFGVETTVIARDIGWEWIDDVHDYYQVGIENVVYVRLNIGVNAIATTVRDARAICRKDEVSFVVTRIDETNGLAVGIITRIIKQAN